MDGGTTIRVDFFDNRFLTLNRNSLLVTLRSDRLHDVDLFFQAEAATYGHDLLDHRDDDRVTLPPNRQRAFDVLIEQHSLDLNVLTLESYYR